MSLYKNGHVINYSEIFYCTLTSIYSNPINVTYNLFSREIASMMYWLACSHQVWWILFELRSPRIKDYINGICIFSAKNEWSILISNNNHWLVRNHGDVSEWGNMSVWRSLFHYESTIKTQISVLIKYKADIIITSTNVAWSRYNIVEILWPYKYFLIGVLYNTCRHFCFLIHTNN